MKRSDSDATLPADTKNISYLEIWKEEGEYLRQAIDQDRTEQRSFRTMIYNHCTFLAVASFAIDSYLLSEKAPGALLRPLTLLVVDAAIIGVLWTLCWRNIIDLKTAAGFLKGREDKLKDHLDGNSVGSPYMLGKPKSLMKEYDIYWMPTLTTMILVAKAITVAILFKGK